MTLEKVVLNLSLFLSLFLPHLALPGCCRIRNLLTAALRLQAFKPGYGCPPPVLRFQAENPSTVYFSLFYAPSLEEEPPH